MAWLSSQVVCANTTCGGQFCVCFGGGGGRAQLTEEQANARPEELPPTQRPAHINITYW